MCKKVIKIARLNIIVHKEFLTFQTYYRLTHIKVLTAIIETLHKKSTPPPCGEQGATDLSSG
jgi:hypothetical protein